MFSIPSISAHPILLGKYARRKNSPIVTISDITWNATNVAGILEMKKDFLPCEIIIIWHLLLNKEQTDTHRAENELFQ